MPKSTVSTSSNGAVGDRGVVAGWHQGWSTVNLRGNPDDPAFREGVARALGAELPVSVCSTYLSSDLKIIWAGPDDWFVISKQRGADELMAALGQALAGQHCAITDVSGGYTVLDLSGPRVNELLAQGCPLDLHPRQFKTGQSAGSVFFKASVWLWKTSDTPSYEMLVRNSFRDYVWLMVEQCTTESGLVQRRFA